MNKEQARARAKQLRDAGDITGMKALVGKQPFLAKELRDFVKYAKSPAFVLAFAEDLVEDNWVNLEIGVAAVTLRDWKLFERAFAVDHDEENFVLWEQAAYELRQAGDVEGAHAIYGAILERPHAQPTAWSAWVATLRATKPTKALVAKLEKAATFGTKRPTIFHNLACAYVRFGDTAKALAAVREAVAAGYSDAEMMRTDDELAPLHGDKRFAAAMKAKPRAFDLAELETTLTIYKQPRLVMRPALGMFFYFTQPIAQLAPLVAQAIEQYLEQIAPVQLGFYKSGRWKALKKGGLGQQLGKLKKPKPGYIHIEVAMRDVDGDATDWSFSAELRGDSDEASELRFTYPRSLDPELAYARFVAFAKLLAPESGSCGLVLATRDNCNVYEGVSYDSQTPYARVLGFERHPMREWNRGTAGAHWLTLLSTKLAAKCGGVPVLNRAIGPAKLAVTDDVVIIRAAARPPVVLATNPIDIGALPLVAKAIAKVRSSGKVASEASYARFDALAPTAYDNE
jgi:tetratricopeptide (TPR) repeat protein